MGFLERMKDFFGITEDRAEESPMVTAEESLLQALIGESNINKKTVLQIPTVKGCIEKIAGTVCRLPIRMYQVVDGEVQEIKDDYRLRLLNADPGDTLNSDEFWRALIEDYYMGKGGYVYINREGLEIKSLHYVKEEDVSIVINSDPIFKDYDIMVNGRTYLPHEFFKIHRRARDGASSLPIWQENPLIFGVAYNSLVFEENLVKKGGNKKGFIESENRLDKDSIDAIRNAWRKVYSNDTENVVVLNKGAKFKESSNTSVEMQLNENKETNGDEICKIFGFPSSILTGGATNNDRKEYIDVVMGLLNTIETALDRDLLLEREKGSFYFAFDTKEITRGDLKERYEAYGIAVEHNIMQIDEVRAREDMPPLGFNWIKIGLNDVLVDPKTGTIYTPNTNKVMDFSNMKGGEKHED